MSAAIASLNVYETDPTVSVSAVASPPVALVYCTNTLSAPMSANPLIVAANEPFANSKTILSPSTIRPKSAFESETLAVPASNEAVTLSPTTINLPESSLNPRPPESVTNPDTSTLSPVPETDSSPFAISGTLTVTVSTSTFCAPKSEPVLFAWTVIVPLELAKSPPLRLKSPLA